MENTEILLQIKKEETVKAHKLTDIKLTAFLLIQDGIELAGTNCDNHDRNGRNQYTFIIVNNSKKTMAQWILDYMNDKVLISAHKYNQKLDDLKDIVHTHIEK